VTGGQLNRVHLNVTRIERPILLFPSLLKHLKNAIRQWGARPGSQLGSE